MFVFWCRPLTQRWTIQNFFRCCLLVCCRSSCSYFGTLSVVLLLVVSLSILARNWLILFDDVLMIKWCLRLCCIAKLYLMGFFFKFWLLSIKFSNVFLILVYKTWVKIVTGVNIVRLVMIVRGVKVVKWEN